jgi:type VI secretion system FHA domain protein
MYLTLEVVSPQAAPMGAERRRIVGPGGLTIGRMPGNDWVIPDPYISKQHARITFVNGVFFVESLGRTAIAIGTAGNSLPGNRPQPLRNGDHLFIDQYEIIVTTVQGEAPGTSSPELAGEDPFAVLPASQPFAAGPARASQSSTIPEVWDGSVAVGLTDTGVLDPLAALGGSRSAQPEPLPPVKYQQASPLEDHFTPPPVRASAAGPPRDLLGSNPVPAAAAKTPAAAGIPDNWDRTNLTHMESPAARPQPRSNDPAPNRVAAPPRRVAPVDPSPRTQSPPRIESPLRVEPPPRVKPQPCAAGVSRVAILGDQSSDAGTSGVGADLTELLRGAGLSDRQLSPEIVRDLGNVLRVVVQGVMDVLRARTEIKSQFRVPLTRIQSAENNPLKHSPDVESALHTLLVQRNPGYLSTVQAFEDAFTDIRNHQMAMLEGVRRAFESMLESFRPHELEKEFERTVKRRGLFGGGKLKYWDLYVERYARMEGDADATFRRLFGDVFAEAYEKQLVRMKNARAK